MLDLTDAQRDALLKWGFGLDAVFIPPAIRQQLIELGLLVRNGDNVAMTELGDTTYDQLAEKDLI